MSNNNGDLRHQLFDLFWLITMFLSGLSVGHFLWA